MALVGTDLIYTSNYFSCQRGRILLSDGVMFGIVAFPLFCNGLRCASIPTAPAR